MERVLQNGKRIERALNNYKKNMDANRKGDAACYDCSFKYCDEGKIIKVSTEKIVCGIY